MIGARSEWTTRLRGLLLGRSDRIRMGSLEIDARGWALVSSTKHFMTIRSDGTPASTTSSNATSPQPLPAIGGHAFIGGTANPHDAAKRSGDVL